MFFLLIGFSVIGSVFHAHLEAPEKAPVQALLCSALQGVSLTALRRQSRRNSGAFWRRCSPALEAQCRRHCRRTILGPSGAIEARIKQRRCRCGLGRRFRRVSSALLERFRRAAGAFQARPQALSPAKGAVGRHCRRCEAPSPRVVRAR